MMRHALALAVMLSLGCGIGRSKMIGPHAPGPDASTGPQLPDVAPLPDGPPQDVLPPLPDGTPGPDTRPPQPDVLAQPDGVPPVAPDVANDLRSADLPPPDLRPSPDLPPEGPPPVGPDARPEGPPPITPDAWPDGPPPVTADAWPDGPPPVMPDVLPDGWPPLPDTRPDSRPPRPDTRPLPPECASGAACTADCTAPCQVIGTLSCTCIDGFLSCGECQVPPIIVSPEPCPDDARGTECTQNGLACLVTSNGSLSGACLCITRGGTDLLRWSCITR